MLKEQVLVVEILVVGSLVVVVIVVEILVVCSYCVNSFWFIFLTVCEIYVCQTIRRLDG